MRCGRSIFILFFATQLFGLSFFVSLLSRDVSYQVEAFSQHLNETQALMASSKIEKVSFPVLQRDGSGQTFTRAAFLVVRPNAIGTVIICHGYTQSKHDSFFLQTFFPYFNVLAFDFRAHGDDVVGQVSTIGQDEKLDVYGAVEFVKSHLSLKDKPIIGFGFSMGAVSLLQAQARYGTLFDALILDSPFDSSDECMERSLDTLLSYKIFGKKRHLPGKKLIMRSLYSSRMQPIMKPIFRWASGMDPRNINTKFVRVNPIEVASKITIPCLFISCHNDKNVASDSVARLYNAVKAPFKRLWISQGMKHCGSCLAQPQLYQYKINSFIRKVLSSKWNDAAKIIDERIKIQAA